MGIIVKGLEKKKSQKWEGTGERKMKDIERKKNREAKTDDGEETS